jgi:hypothetical protein
MTQRERSRQARRKWEKLICEQGRSGQRVAAFCRERELGASHFYWWKKRLRAAGSEARGAPMTRFVEVKLAGAGPECPARDSLPGGDGRVEILLRNGRSLRVGPGFDPELVRALAAVVESAA